MLEKKRRDLENEREVYEFGLVKLEETESKVGELQKNLVIIQKEVDQKKEDADKVAKIVGAEKSKVEEENKKAMIEEEKCTSIKQDVEIQKA